METKFQSSFIPKKSFGSPATGSSSGAIGFFTSVAVVVFLIVAALWAGVFIWGKTVKAEILEMEGDLVAAREAFNPALVQELTRLDNRIESAKKLLAAHLAVSAVFDLLEKSTLLNVSYGDFDFSVGSSGEIKVLLEGQAKSFNSVALQSDSFAGEKFIKNPIFSDVNLDDSGNVLFTFVATLDPALLSYKGNLLESFLEPGTVSGLDRDGSPPIYSELAD